MAPELGGWENDMGGRTADTTVVVLVSSTATTPSGGGALPSPCYRWLKGGGTYSRGGNSIRVEFLKLNLSLSRLNLSLSRLNLSLSRLNLSLSLRATTQIEFAKTQFILDQLNSSTF